MISYMYLIVIILTLFVSFYFINKLRIFKIVNSFESYRIILEYHMQKAYDIIYKDKILIYSIEAIRISDIDFEIVTKEFIKLVFKLIGPNLRKEFETLYGNEETLMFNLVEYFNTKFESDEIRKKSEETLTNDESFPNNLVK